MTPAERQQDDSAQGVIGLIVIVIFVIVLLARR